MRHTFIRTLTALIFCTCISAVNAFALAGSCSQQAPGTPDGVLCGCSATGVRTQCTIAPVFENGAAVCVGHDLSGASESTYCYYSTTDGCICLTDIKPAPRPIGVKEPTGRRPAPIEDRSGLIENLE